MPEVSETRTGGSLALGSRSISRIATRISLCILPPTWTLREAGNGPVVTAGSAFVIADEGRGAESGKAASISAVSRHSRIGGVVGRVLTRAILSLRRHNPDQVQRLSAAP